MKIKIAVGVVALLTVLFALFGSKLLNKSDNEEVASEPQEIVLSDTEWSKGASEPKAVLVEYGDFQCPACGAFFPFVKGVGEEFPNDLQIVFRHFPLNSIHRNAMVAAQAAEAAGLQGKFWEMHDLLFINQQKWSNKLNATSDFIAFANQLELNEEQFLNDFQSKEVKEKINEDIASGNKLKVNSTPSFFLNGETLVPSGLYEEFKAVIREAINQ